MSDSPHTAKPDKHYPTARPKVPAFARYQGTSAWRKYRNRVREYYRHLAAEKAVVGQHAG